MSSISVKPVGGGFLLREVRTGGMLGGGKLFVYFDLDQHCG